MFCHKALAKVFRAKILDGLRQAGIALPANYPADWVVDCQAVGAGDKALVYLGRYLYRGVLPEKHILSNENGQVTFRYQNGQTKQWQTRILDGVSFLKLILKHILPKGFRRARNYGFLHPNCKLVKWVQLIKRIATPPPTPRPTIKCACCQQPMRILRTRVNTVWAHIMQQDKARETAM
ncbi:transposase (fragment) [Nitrosomonas mobilis]|uniref:Transposase n=1 Tax=Nitrosomonas mobilis TaxID=51642 RepID=A0A1G5SFQ9_9PROT